MLLPSNEYGRGLELSPAQDSVMESYGQESMELKVSPYYIRDS